MDDFEAGDARYVFRVRFRLAPAPSDVDVDPDTFETLVSRRAAPPGEEGWLFFRDNLWRGAVGDEPYLRELTEEALGVPVETGSSRRSRGRRKCPTAGPDGTAP